MNMMDNLLHEYQGNQLYGMVSHDLSLFIQKNEDTYHKNVTVMTTYNNKS